MLTTPQIIIHIHVQQHYFWACTQMFIEYSSRVVKRSSIITSSLLSAYIKSNEVTNHSSKLN